MFGAMEGVTAQAVLNLDSHPTGAILENLPPTGQIRCTIPRFPLPAGEYFIHVWGRANQDLLDEVHNVLMLTVAGGDFFQIGRAAHPATRTVLVDQVWRVEPAEPEVGGVAAAEGAPTPAT
jgi:hypothetical protein